MCGRYSIYEPMAHYLKELGSKQIVINGYDEWPFERYNVARALAWRLFGDRKKV